MPEQKQRARNRGTSPAGHRQPPAAAQLQQRFGNRVLSAAMSRGWLEPPGSPPLAVTMDGQTAFAPEVAAHPERTRIAAHEAVHRAQFAARGDLPVGSPAQLESEAARGAEQLAGGGDFRPALAAPPGIALEFPSERESEPTLANDSPFLRLAVDGPTTKSADEAILRLAWNVISGLGGGFARGLASGVDEEHLREFTSGLEQGRNAREFLDGIEAGVLLGAVKDLYGNIAFLVELAWGALKLSVKVAAAIQPAALAHTATRFAFNIGNYRNDSINRGKDALTAAGEIAGELGGLLQALMTELLFSPEPLLRGSQELGAAVGRIVADRANATVFAAKPYFARGVALGEVIGIVLTEIALLFVALEVAVIKGLAETVRGASETIAAARLLKDSRLATQLVKLLKDKPHLRKLLGLADEARNVRAAERTVEQAGSVVHASTGPVETRMVAGDRIEVPGLVPDTVGGGTRTWRDTEVFLELETVTLEGAVEPRTTPRSTSAKTLMRDSAAKYSGRMQDQWLHLRALWHGALHEAKNLVAGGKGANRVMMPFEKALRAAAEEAVKNGTDLPRTQVTAHLRPGTRIAERIEVKAWINVVDEAGNNKLELVLDAFVDAAEQWPDKLDFSWWMTTK